MNNWDLGKIGEDMAAGMLQAKGFSILARNYRCAAGEIDIIAKCGSRIKFIEVKTRRGICYGRPCESVNFRKQKRIRGAAVYFLRENSCDVSEYMEVDFDVMEIVVNHMEGVF